MILNKAILFEGFITLFLFVLLILLCNLTFITFYRLDGVIVATGIVPDEISNIKVRMIHFEVRTSLNRTQEIR